MKKILLTGGAGFIGSNFAHYLVKNSDLQVTILDAFTYAANEQSLLGLPQSRVEVVKGNICDKELVGELVRQHDTVVNFAAESHNDRSLASPREFLDANIIGTFTLLEAVRDHSARFHHISTDEVFGDLPLGSTEKFTEVTPYNPSSPYSATKASSDLLVRAWVRSYGISATISNCSNNYGPRQHVEKFIPRQITNILKGSSPVLYGDGLNVRDWIHVEDHCSAILEILKHGRFGETYLVGCNGERTNREVLQLICEVMGFDAGKIQVVADRSGHDLRYAIDATKLSNELDWKPKHSEFEDGIRETIEWYEANFEWWESQKTEAENFYLRVAGQS